MPKCSPFSDTLLQATSEIATCPQECHRFISKDTIGTTITGDDVTIWRQFLEPRFQFGERDGTSPRQMAGLVLKRRAHIQEHHALLSQRLAQFIDGHGTKRSPIPQKGGDKVIDFGQVILAPRPKRQPKPATAISGQPLEN